MEAYFPTLDDLIMGCGQHFLESLRLPPPERAAEIFGGAASERERVRRLVDTIFGAYEREGAGLEGGKAGAGPSCRCWTSGSSSWTWRSTRWWPRRCARGSLTPPRSRPCARSPT